MVSSYETDWAQREATPLMKSNHLLTGKLSARLLSDVKNSCFSPLSIQIALTVLMTGSRNLTWAEIAGALGIGSLHATELERSYTDFIDVLNEKPFWIQPEASALMSIANSIWLSKRVSVQKIFAMQASEIFDAEIKDVDFRSRWAVADINKWVTQKTNGKITSIADRLPGEMLMALINVVYFLCNWQEQFSLRNTKEAEFTIPSGITRLVPMMNRTATFSYFENDYLQAIAIPYLDTRFSFYVFLPKEKQRSESIADLLKEPKWWLKFRPAEVYLSLPRFSFSWGTDLRQQLSELGMPGVFTTNSDYSGIVQPPMRATIEALLHKTFIKVNESGTEAAAVTAGVMFGSAFAPDQAPPIRMNVNRTFGFALMNMPIQSALFVGSVCDPVEVDRSES